MFRPLELMHNYEALFDPNEASESETVRRRRRAPASKHYRSSSTHDDDGEHNISAVPDREVSVKSHELWQRVGETAAGRPVLQTWETRHRSESYWFLDVESGDGHPSRMPCHPMSESTLYKRSDDQFRTSPDSCPRDESETVSEGDLVRDAKYALQGLPAAVTKLENLSRAYCASAADKSVRTIPAIFASAVTTSALGQVLAVLASAGRVRCQLDTFVGYFLDDLIDPYEGERDGDSPRISRRARRRKMAKKRKPGEIVQPEVRVSEVKSPGNAGSSERKVSHQCLVNQAFASAVKGILRGHSGALDTLAASVSVRRAQGTAAETRERDPGPAVGCRSHDTSLLEFYLHTRELRVQLHTLAFICLVRKGEPAGQRRAGNSFSLRRVPSADSSGGNNSGTIEYSSHLLARTFEDFPRGADLLTYLYDQLTEMDPLRLELLTFLFECAYEPYSYFIQSWLYEGSVRDPYGEFFLHLADVNEFASASSVQRNLVGGQPVVKPEFRRDVLVPKFMEGILTPLIRAGEQLQVLLKLADTSNLAEQMSTSTRTSGMLWPWNSAKSTLQYGRNSPALRRLTFRKRKLETAQQRKRRSEELKRQFDVLFSEMSRRHKKGGSRSASLLIHDDADEVQRDWPSVDDPESHETFVEPPLSLPARRELSEYNSLRPSDASPKGNSCAGADDDSTELESAVSDVNYRGVSRDVFINRDVSAPMTVKEMGQTLTSSAPAYVLDTQRLYQSPKEDFGCPSSTDGSEGRSEVHPRLCGHEREPCRPAWGSLVNPYFVQAEGEDSSPTSYFHPSFIKTFENPSVAEQFVSNISSVSMSRRTSFVETGHTIGPDWFKRSDVMGLDAQLELLSWEQGDTGRARVPSAELEVVEYRDLAPRSRVDPRLTYPVVFSLADGSKAEVLNLLESVKGPTDTLNSSPFLASNFVDTLHLSKLTILESSQTQPQYGDFSVDSKSRSGTLAAILLPQSTCSRDSPWIPSAESGMWKRNQKVFPQGTEFDEQKDISGRYSRESCLKLEVLESGEVDFLAAKEVTDNLRSLEKISVSKFQEGLPGENSCGTNPLINGASQFCPGSINYSCRAIVSKSLGTGEEQGAVKWEEYLSSFDRSAAANLKINKNCSNEDDVSADDEVPHSIMVSKCIADEVLYQYYFVSTLTVQLLQMGLCMQDHCAALRRYFFMEQGDWAEYFSVALCQHRWGPVLGQHRLVEVQGMLEVAFQRSSCDGDEYAGRFHISFQDSDHGFTTSSIDCYRLDAFDFIALQYSVDWPLSLILTRHSLGLYNIVFTFLMRIKITVHALGDIWQRLQVIDRRLQKARPSSTYQRQRSRFRTLQQFRQQIYHFVTTVQRYVESKLLHVWSKFLEDIQLKAHDMRDLEMVHREYVEAAIKECFLCVKTSGVKGCIDSVLQCVLDFSSYLKKASFQRNEDLNLIDDNLSMEVGSLKNGFQGNLRELHNFCSRPEAQTQINLNDLWMILDYNGFHTIALSTGPI